MQVARISIFGFFFTDHAISALADWNIIPDDLNDIPDRHQM